MPVLIALMHDVLITGGVYALTGREVTTSTVAALLTILGFSLYDTIIVFDRVRENVPRMPSAAFSQIVNRSMSEVVVRSLATSFCTLLPVLALYFLGGETLQDFAFALIVGTASRHLLVDLHRGPGAHALEGARAGLRARERRIRSGSATCPRTRPSSRAAPVDVAPAAPRGGRRGGITTPQDPAEGVSRAEFDDMVANLGIEESRAPRARGRARASRPAAAAVPAPAARRPSAAARGRTASGSARRRRRRAPEAQEAPQRKHGRPR